MSVNGYTVQDEWEYYVHYGAAQHGPVSGAYRKVKIAWPDDDGVKAGEGKDWGDHMKWMGFTRTPFVTYGDPDGVFFVEEYRFEGRADDSFKLLSEPEPRHQTGVHHACYCLLTISRSNVHIEQLFIADYPAYLQWLREFAPVIQMSLAQADHDIAEDERREKARRNPR